MLNSIRKHVTQEVFDGFSDNLHGLKHTIFHPIETLKELWQAVRHPLDTLTNLAAFAWRHPIRFGSNIGVSVLEGKIIGAGLNQFTSQLESATKAATIIPEALNVTESASPILNSFLSTSTSSTSTLSNLPVCTPQSCMLPATSASSTSTTALTAAVTQKNNKR